MAEENGADETGEVSQDDMKDMSAEEIAELQRKNCIFCKIASKEVPSKILHEDDDVICILDINPASEGHIIIFPKKHFMIMPHLPDDILGKLFNTVKLMSNTLLKTLQCKGTSVFVANGMAAGQKAPHVLIHVFPRNENDGLLEMPKYEITAEQASKMHSSLKPYIARAFGEKIMPALKQSVDLSPKMVEQEENDIENPRKAEKKPAHSKSINLDDVSKLFGG